MRNRRIFTAAGTKQTTRDRARRFHPLALLGSAALGIALMGACSAESLTERVLEQAIEGDQDIDLDFGDDGTGGFKISTDEGEFALNIDGENGMIQFDSDEGQGSISFDEDGIVFDTTEGDGAISFDEDGIVFDTDEGEGSISFDEDEGTVNFSSDEGEGSYQIAGADAPDGWPAFIGPPATVDSDNTVYTAVAGEDGKAVLIASFEHGTEENYPQALVDALIDQGWDQMAGEPGSFTGLSSFTDGQQMIQIMGFAPGVTQVSVIDLEA